MAAGQHLSEADPFLLFNEFCTVAARHRSAHAFYLGYEMAKAVTALTLDKEYRQDESLDWGHLTKPEQSHRLKRGQPWRTNADAANSEDEDST